MDDEQARARLAELDEERQRERRRRMARTMMVLPILAAITGMGDPAPRSEPRREPRPEPEPLTPEQRAERKRELDAQLAHIRRDAEERDHIEAAKRDEAHKKLEAHGYEIGFGNRSREHARNLRRLARKKAKGG